MPEKHESDTMLDLYENAVADNLKDLDEEEDSVEIISPILDPRVELPANFPDIGGCIQRLGTIPISINHDFGYMKLNYSMGNIFYTFDEEDFCYYPKSITLLDSKHINKVRSEISFDLIKNGDIPEEQIDWDTHYLINENRVLRVNLPDSNTPAYLEKE